MKDDKLRQNAFAHHAKCYRTVVAKIFLPQKKLFLDGPRIKNLFVAVTILGIGRGGFMGGVVAIVPPLNFFFFCVLLRVFLCPALCFP